MSNTYFPHCILFALMSTDFGSGRWDQTAWLVVFSRGPDRPATGPAGAPGCQELLTAPAATKELREKMITTSIHPFCSTSCQDSSLSRDAQSSLSPATSSSLSSLFPLCWFRSFLSASPPTGAERCCSHADRFQKERPHHSGPLLSPLAPSCF